MLFSLEVLKARHGDCLILHYGAGQPRFIVVDGGPAGVYEESLQPRLDELQAGPCNNQTLPIDLLIVTHIDDDHIQGVLDLMDDLRSGGKPYKIRTLWHNSFGKMLGQADDAIPTAHGGAVVGAAAVANSPYGLLAKIGLPVTPAGVQQGMQLVEAAKDLHLTPLNSPFSELVMAPESGKRDVGLPDGLTLTVLHPNAKRIEKLCREWANVVNKPKSTRGSAAAPAASVDDSPANLSSIVVMAECQGKRMLLTGDALGDDIIKALQKAKLVKNGTCDVDVLKLPHHGSDKNVKPDFFKTVRADHYVVSGDGAHGNPEIKTLRMLSNARPKDRFTLHLTYKTGKKELGPKLRDFFAKEKQKGRKYAVNYPGKGDTSIKIDLLDALTY